MCCRSINPHSLTVSISSSLPSGFRLNASSWPMFLLKTLNGAEMAPVRIFHKVFPCLCRSFWQSTDSELLSHQRCAGPIGGDTAQLRAALGQTCVLSSCVIAVSGCSQRSAKEVFGLQGSGLRQELVFHWGCRCCSKWGMQGGNISTSLECPTPWLQSSSE